MEPIFRNPRPARPRFVALIEGYRIGAPPAGQALQDLAAEVGYNPEVDGPILERLCADDARTKRFWELTERLLDSEVDWIIGQLLFAVTAGEAVPKTARACAAELARVEWALATLEALFAAEVLTWPDLGFATALRRDGAAAAGRPPREDNFPLPDGTLVSCLSGAKAQPVRRRDALAAVARGTAVSRKAKNAPHVLFMVDAADTLDEYFPQPTLDIVADLVSVIYDVEVGAEAVRKARERNAQEEAKRSKEVDEVAERLKELTRPDNSSPKINLNRPRRARACN